MHVHPHERVSSASEYCPNEQFNPECHGNGVIVMTRALYGHMRETQCLNHNHSVGCSSDALRTLDSLCSARRTCDVSVFNELHEHSRGDCPAYVTRYLEAEYTCVAGE